MKNRNLDARRLAENYSRISEGYVHVEIYRDCKLVDEAEAGLKNDNGRTDVRIAQTTAQEMMRSREALEEFQKRYNAPEEVKRREEIRKEVEESIKNNRGYRL